MAGSSSPEKSNSSRIKNKPVPGILKIAAIQSIFETALELGYDLTEQFAAFGITPERVEQGDTYISLRHLGELLSIAAKMTQRDDFPILLASRQHVPKSVRLLLLMRTAPTLRDAFRDGVRFGHMYAQSTKWNLHSSEDAERATFALLSQDVPPQLLRFCAELFLVQGYQFVKSMLGSTLPLERVYFAFSRSSNDATFSQFFQAPVEYESEVFGFEFVKGTLDSPLLYANEDLHDSILDYMSSLEQQELSSLDQKVRAVIHSLLPSGAHSIELVAQTFGCCGRTLQRRLKTEGGTTYHELLEEVRFELAQQYLAQSRMPVTQVSLAVGFSNPTSFTRGFKRVVGCSPREWRNQHRTRNSH